MLKLRAFLLQISLPFIGFERGLDNLLPTTDTYFSLLFFAT